VAEPDALEHPVRDEKAETPEAVLDLMKQVSK
jgi:hypothetical protein